MKRYIGTKLINAKPMTRQAYNDFRGWTLPADEKGADEGYLVEYVDGGKGNTDHYAGYVSWSPADVFDRAYRPCEGMTFGQAIEAMKDRQKVARAGWNGKGQWLTYVGTGFYDVGMSIVNPHHGMDKILRLRPWIGIKTVDDQFMPWLASQSDMLSDDWRIVE
jgi:hypothetical protein